MNSGSNAKAKSCGSDTKNIKKVKTAHLNTSKTRNKTPQKHVIKVDKQRKIG